MKKLLLYTRHCFIILLLTSCYKPSLATNYYFSSSSGDDSRTQSSAGLPWKSIEKLNSIFNQLNPGDSVFFKKGDTFYGTITVNTSGSPEKPIVISAYGEGVKPVITSFKIINDWKPTGNKNIYVSHIEIPGRLQVAVLNNQPKAMGRYPNDGYLYFESHDNNKSITDNELYDDIDWTSGELVLRTKRWVLDRIPIVSRFQKTIILGESKSTPIDHFGYFIQNHLATLDTDGEWFYDNERQSLYMYSANSLKSTRQVKVATLDNLITTSNAPAYISFLNLAIKGCNKDGIEIINGSNIYFKSCDISFSGVNGIRVSKHNNFKIDSSTVTYSYNDGINVSGTTGALITNNIVKNSYFIIGMGGSGEGMGAGIRNGNKGIVEHNQIINSGYVAIQLGGDSVIIKNNVIDSFCFIKDDGGAIYSSNGKKSTNNGRKIVGNIISNGLGAADGTSNKSSSSAEGIYLDDNVNGVEINTNTITNCHWGIYLHNAYNIQVTDNTSYNNAVQFYAKHDKNHVISNISFLRNNLIAQKPDQKVMSLISSEDDIKSFGSFNNNLYRSFNKNNLIYIQYKAAESIVKDRPTLSTMKQMFGFEANSDLNNSDNDADETNTTIRVITNPSNKSKTFTLDQAYIDKMNKPYQKSVTVPPYSSIVLFKK